MSLKSDVADYVPRFLAEKRKKRFERVHARMKADAETLIRMEFDSCLEILRSKKKLRELENVLALGERVRFLAILLDENIDGEFALYHQEREFRNARYAARRHVKNLRWRIESGRAVMPERYAEHYRALVKSLLKGGLSLEDLGASDAEMNQFKRLSGIA